MNAAVPSSALLALPATTLLTRKSSLHPGVVAKQDGALATAKFDVNENSSAKSPPLQFVPLDATLRVIVYVVVEPVTEVIVGELGHAAAEVLPVVRVDWRHVVAHVYAVAAVLAEPDPWLVGLKVYVVMLAIANPATRDSTATIVAA